MRKCKMCKVLLLSDPGSRRWFVPFGKSFFVNARRSSFGEAELLVADREEGARLCGEEKNREEQILIGQLRRHHARPCIAHFLEAPLRISPGTFLDPGAGGHGAGQILLCSHKPEAPAKGVRKCLSFNALRWRFRLVAGLIGLKRQRRAFEKKRGTNSPPAEVLLAPSPSRDGRLQSSVRCRHGRYGPLFSITSGVRLSWS